MNNIDLVLEAINTLQPLFEVGGPEEVPPSENKISKKKKDKDGETKEVVSVADELFPKEGNAKQQFNQKVIDKINDMIQGTATLEDLIQLVSRKQAAKKQVHEGLDELSEKISIVEEIIQETSANLIKAVSTERMKRRAANPNSREAENKMDNNAYLSFKRLSKKGKRIEGNPDPIEKAIIKHGANVFREKIFPEVQSIEDETVESGKILKKIGRVQNELEKHGDKGQNTDSKIKTIVRKGMKKVDALEEGFEKLDNKLAVLEEIINEVSKEYRNKKALKVKNDVENERDIVDKLPELGIPDQIVKDLETDVIRKEHKIYPRINKIEQEIVNKAIEAENNKKRNK